MDISKIRFQQKKQIRITFTVDTGDVFFNTKDIFMSTIIFIGIVLLTFFTMEGITWLTHKYVMHGFLWYLHEDHHQPTPGFFEKNDAFF